ncbi:hypothetical protein GCM10008025_39040 [Ornithinibacillus halotolerans]|uniref:Uncharacterized protein n=1 Tax=Ornithinibacillus halotolerans TaxID=1274357 RepID=A0A916SBS9_9BACI|nr:hypothetical protein GCM10008025_39040 [Ornithinibacillus halotolerans]
MSDTSRSLLDFVERVKEVNYSIKNACGREFPHAFLFCWNNTPVNYSGNI